MPGASQRSLPAALLAALSTAPRRRRAACSVVRATARTTARTALPVVVFLAAVLAGACDRKPAPARVDSTPAPAPAVTPPAPTPPPTTTWDPDAGTALLVPGAQGEALVVVPGTTDSGVTDTSSGPAEAVLPADVALFTRAGAAGQARATAAPAPHPEDDACSVWPTARLGPASGADAVPRWTVGFVGGHAAPIPLDSLEGLTSADSATLTAALARAASGLPGDTARRLRGLPFAVRSARRFWPEPGTEVVVAVLARALNQEATPAAERVLVVVERERGGSAPFTVAYHERTVGSEETIESPDVLAAVRLGGEGGTGGRPVLVLSRDYYEGSAYTLLEREGAGRWRVRWTSAYRGC
jgi:hypothetical protein